MRLAPRASLALSARRWSAPGVAGCRDAASIDALLVDKGSTVIRFVAEMASAEIDVIIPPTWNPGSAAWP